MNQANTKVDETPRGLVCPKCGCRHFELVKITHAVGYVRRRRACRHCGHRVTTTERIVSGKNPRTNAPGGRVERSVVRNAQDELSKAVSTLGASGNH